MGKVKIDKLIKQSKNIGSTVVDSVMKTTSGAVNMTKNVVNSTTEKITQSVEKQKEERERKAKDLYQAAWSKVSGTQAEHFITQLGESPVRLTDYRISSIKSVFPIPKEQYIFWVDAEFDLRPSGIAVTDCGVFIRTNVGVFDKKEKPALFYYSWSDFDPGWFVSDSENENKALLVEPQCRRKFISVCKTFSISDLNHLHEIKYNETSDVEHFSKMGTIAGAAVESAQKAVFVEQKSHINTPSGHGEMAEEAITLLDKLHGINAKVVGRDNAKDGADRVIDNSIFVQTKYYKTARGSLEACFNSETGMYRYMKDEQPMQLEVPKDQYQKILEGFKKKILDGKVPGVSDPKQAEEIVRKGRLDYKNAVNLTKAGTIESLSYDALTGAVTCTCAFGITFVATCFLAWRKTGDMNKSIEAGVNAGTQVFGISFVQHIIVSQMARTSLANSLIAPSQYIVGKMGTQASATIVNGIRALSGKSAIYGAAATKHLAKIMRSNAVTSALTFAVFSIPETYGLVTKKISVAQYTKNMSVLTASIVGGAGGAVAAGVATAKISGAAGTVVAPGIGTAVGIVGGLAGGMIGAKAVNTVGDILHENDIDKYGRLLNAYISCIVGEYLFDEGEIDQLITVLDGIQPKEYKRLFENISKSDEQENVIREFLEPKCMKIAAKRERFLLPSNEYISKVISPIAYEEDYI